MDPFERQFGFRRQINVQAIVAFALGVLGAFLVQSLLKPEGGTVLETNQLLTFLIVVGIGGLWYHIRRVI